MQHGFERAKVCELYRPIELTFEGSSELAIGREAPIVVSFHHADHDIDVPGFWDGGVTYRVRMCPEAVGRWTWSTRAETAGIAATSGAFDVVPSEHAGPVRVAHRFHFAHADGTAFRPVGTTVYNWLHQDQDLFADTIGAVASAGFNKLRFLVFPQAGGYVEHFPELLPFEKAGGGWDVSAPVIPFFRRLDNAVEKLGNSGIQADVIIFNAYDHGRFGFDALSEEEDEVYLRYLVARLSAYPHVWWSLCNEFDQLERPAARWDRVGSLLAEIDPHRHLRSIHNWVELYDNNQAWVTHASIQNGSATAEFGRANLYRDVWGKPVVLDEIKYEGDAPERWGDLCGRQLVHQFWIATVSGCYASHGESFTSTSGSLHMVEGGSFRGEAPARLKFLRQILDSLVVGGVDPVDKWDDPWYVAGVARRQYLLYLGDHAPDHWSFRLPQGVDGDRLVPGDKFAVDVIDTWAMTITRVSDTFVLTEVGRNDAYDRAAAPLRLPQNAAIALRITRVV